MVFYECLVTAKNTTHFYMLTDIVKQASHEIVKGGGIVRAVHNHGIRTLPHRFKARFPDKEGNRYYTKGRFFSVYYDANPTIMKQVEQNLRMEEEVLRSTHLKARSVLDFANVREDRNPYVKRVLREEEKDREALHHRNETVESVIEDMRTDDA